MGLGAELDGLEYWTTELRICNANLFRRGDQRGLVSSGVLIHDSIDLFGIASQRFLFGSVPAHLEQFINYSDDSDFTFMWADFMVAEDSFLSQISALKN